MEDRVTVSTAGSKVRFVIRGENVGRLSSCLTDERCGVETRARKENKENVFWIVGADCIKDRGME